MLLGCDLFWMARLSYSVRFGLWLGLWLGSRPELSRQDLPGPCLNDWLRLWLKPRQCFGIWQRLCLKPRHSLIWRVVVSNGEGLRLGIALWRRRRLKHMLGVGSRLGRSDMVMGLEVLPRVMRWKDLWRDWTMPVSLSICFGC